MSSKVKCGERWFSAKTPKLTANDRPSIEVGALDVITCSILDAIESTSLPVMEVELEKVVYASMMSSLVHLLNGKRTSESNAKHSSGAATTIS
jgi:hypothetical protein